MADDTTSVRQSLSEAGIEGVEDFGRFVNNTEYFAPSKFDERSAMPVLLALLPSLTEPKVVQTVASHLRRPWARPAAFQVAGPAYRPRGEVSASVVKIHGMGGEALADQWDRAAT